MPTRTSHIVNRLDSLGLIPPPEEAAESGTGTAPEAAAPEVAPEAPPAAVEKEEKKDGEEEVDIPKIILHKIVLGDIESGRNALHNLARGLFAFGRGKKTQRLRQQQLVLMSAHHFPRGLFFVSFFSHFDELVTAMCHAHRKLQRISAPSTGTASTHVERSAHGTAKTGSKDSPK